MKVIIENNWTKIPFGGMEVYNPKFRDMDIYQIMDNINPSNNWLPFGYDRFIINKETATVFIQKSSA